MSGIDRTQAKRLTRLSQAAAVVLAAGAAMAFIVEPGLPDAPQIIRNDTPNQTPSNTGPATTIEFDISLASDMLNQAGEVTPDFPNDAETPDDTAELEPVIVTPTAGPGSNFRFLGGFFSPKRSLAIIAGAGKQKMVREGDMLDFGFTVTSITSDMVEIERNGEVERLPREEPSGVMVASAKAPDDPEQSDDRVSPDTRVGQSARDRLRNARTEANNRTQTDRAKLRADYERQRQQRIEELREQGVEVDEAEWRRDD